MLGVQQCVCMHFCILQVSLVLECLQQILLRVADDLSQYRSPAGTSVVLRLLTGDCLKCVLGQMASHSRVPHIKAALRLLSTMTSVSDVAAREVMLHFDALQPALLRLLYRKSVSGLHFSTLFIRHATQVLLQ